MNLLSALPYPISIAKGCLADFPFDCRSYSSVFVITDEVVAKLWSKQILKSLSTSAKVISIKSGEEHKNFETLKFVWTELMKNGADRNSLLINLGGGVVGDLGGFAASCYMRGVDFVQAPTTLLSQVDASVGGKLGIDFAGVKNLVGSFKQPAAVIIDLDTLTTLPIRELASGMAEIIKHALIRSTALLEEINQLNSLQDFSSKAKQLIEYSLKIKAEVVLCDPHEKGLRKILNFGHSLGHAIEGFFLGKEQSLVHGEAIALGMLAELKLGELLGITDKKVLPRLKKLLARMQLPTALPAKIDLNKTLELLRHDKKNSANEIRFSLLKSVGECVFGIPANTETISKALESIAP